MLYKRTIHREPPEVGLVKNVLMGGAVFANSILITDKKRVTKRKVGMAKSFSKKYGKNR